MHHLSDTLVEQLFELADVATAYGAVPVLMTVLPVPKVEVDLNVCEDFWSRNKKQAQRNKKIKSKRRSKAKSAGKLCNGKVGRSSSQCKAECDQEGTVKGKRTMGIGAEYKDHGNACGEMSMHTPTPGDKMKDAATSCSEAKEIATTPDKLISQLTVRRTEVNQKLVEEGHNRGVLVLDTAGHFDVVNAEVCGGVKPYGVVLPAHVEQKLTPPADEDETRAERASESGGKVHPDKQKQVQSWWDKDGVHLNRYGYNELGRFIFRCISSLL